MNMLYYKRLHNCPEMQVNICLKKQSFPSIVILKAICTLQIGLRTFNMLQNAHSRVKNKKNKHYINVLHTIQ